MTSVNAEGYLNVSLYSVRFQDASSFLISYISFNVEYTVPRWLGYISYNPKFYSRKICSYLAEYIVVNDI